MFGSTRRRQGRESHDDLGPDDPVVIPILRETTSERSAPSPAPESTDFYVSDNSAGNDNGRVTGHEAAAGGKKTLLPEPLVRALSYGVVNGIVLIPVAVSSGAIIFSDPAFTAHLPRLGKLVMFSCAVHMACIGSLSSLKFAVGLVQDAGLIFLSAIGSAVVLFCREERVDEATMLSTACFVMCTCTGLLGVGLVVLGRLKLASVAQYLPMPVIGGYLAFIGYFCGQAGLALASGVHLTRIQDLSMLANREALMLVAPAILGGVLYYLFLRRFPSPMTLPLLMAAFVGAFFSILTVTSTSLEDARSLGWLTEESPMLPLNRAWDYFSVTKVRWGALIRVIPTLLAMTAVVAFSSSLDIAAIEMETGKPLDFNRELQTVGWSNVVSGLFGGFTGSYTFSQTIFNLRAGIDTRVAGATTCVMLVAAAALPVNVTSFLPRAFFGALLVFFCVDLMVEWLWRARLRMALAEYTVCVATFVCILSWGVEKGMVAGLVLAALSFTVSYAQVPTVMTARMGASTVMRTFEERVILQAHRRQTVVLELQGYIFFGSAVKILSDVKKRIVWGAKQSEVVLSSGSTANIILNSDTTASNQGMGGTTPPAHAHIPDLRHLDATASNASVVNPLAAILSPAHSRAGAVLPLILTSSPAQRGGLTPSGTITRSQKLRECYTPAAVHQQTPPPLCPKPAVAVPGRDGGNRGDGPRVRSWSTSTAYKHSNSSGAGAECAHPDEQACLVDRGGSNANPEGNAAVVVASTNVDYGAMEEGDISDDGGGEGEADEGGVSTTWGCVPTPGRHRSVKHAASFWADSRIEENSERAEETAVHTYMSLWANGGVTVPNSRASSESAGLERPGRSNSVVSVLPRSEQRTRRVILDFSNVVGIDATAVRSCFLMLKVVLHASGVEVVFSGVSDQVHALMRSHGVIAEEDPVFSSLDTALEWSEERMLQERQHDVFQRGSAGVGADASSSFAPALRSAKPLKAPTAEPQVLEAVAQDAGGGDENITGDDGSDSAKTPSAASAEAAVFLGDHEDYYARAGLLRRRSSLDAWIADIDDKLIVGDVGSLQSILEDYLEVDRYQMPESVRSLLSEAHRFFTKENVATGAVLADNRGSPESAKVYFIGSGSVELQIPGELGPRRLRKVCAGGTFGEMGFYLGTPQTVFAVAREPCHLHALDRKGMTMMQRENPGLCVLVQKAVIKSICLAASVSIESTFLGPVDNGRSGWFSRVEGAD